MSDTASEKGLPTITESHIAALLNAGRGKEHQGRFEEGLKVLRSLASGSHTLVPTDELRRLLNVLLTSRDIPPALGEIEHFTNAVSRWLSPSTPEEVK